MRRLLSSGSVAVAAIALAGCGGEPSADAPDRAAGPRAVTIGVQALPATLDPARAATVAELAIATAVHTPLLTYRRRADASAGTLEPALARKLPKLSGNDLEYTFQLRPGLLYADGRLVKASDVERAIAHASLHAASREVRDVLANIAGPPSADGSSLAGVVSDDRTGTVAVRLRQPDGRLPLALALPATAPLPELPSSDPEAESPAATGPLRVARRTATSVDLVANPLRAPIAAVPAAGVAQVTLTAAPLTASALSSGRVDLALDPGGAAVPESGRVVDAPSGAITSVLFSPVGRFASRAVRSEFAAVLDLRALRGTASARSASTTPTATVQGAGRAASEEPFGVPACGLLPSYVVGAVTRDACPAAPADASSRPLAALTIRLAIPRTQSTAVAPVSAAIEALGGVVSTLPTADPANTLRAGRADVAIVRVQPTLPHPAAWLTPAAQADALLAREVPRLLAGPLTGSASRWSALERRAVDRAVNLPLLAGRSRVFIGVDVDRGSVLLHPVLGVDLAALHLD